MIKFIAGAALLFVAACIIAASFLVRGRRQTEEEAMEWQSSRYDTSFYGRTEKTDYTVDADGYTLNVQLLKCPEDTGRYVIISHGYTDNRIGSLKYARFYLELGYNCIVYDLRGHGRNARTATTFGYREGKDLALLVKDTRERYSDIRVLGLQGESLGSGTTVMSLKYSPDIDFAVADCCYADFRKVLAGAMKMVKLPSFLLNMADIGLRLAYGCSLSDMKPVEALKDNTVPILFVHGTEDSLIPASSSRELCDAANGLGTLCLIEGSEHAMSAIDAPDRYLETLREFLEASGIGS